VWIDALQNYITAVGYASDEDTYRRIWPADIHFMAKDILWFHTVIWQAMLMALDLPLPATVYAHGYLQVGGEKMSKSRLTGISPHDLLPVFGSDGYRYYFMRDVSFGLDGEFSWEGMVARYNSDLANDFGNLVSRVTAMVGRYLDGRVPKPPSAHELTESESSLRAAQRKAFDDIEAAMGELALHDALRSGWGFVRKANSYVEEVAPWALAKDPSMRRRLEVALYELVDALRLLAVMVWPIAPRAAQELWGRLGLQGSMGDVTLPEADRWDLLPEDNEVRTGPPLFPRIEDDGRQA
jgi:methionyl-tRNA synthetase